MKLTDDQIQQVELFLGQPEVQTILKRAHLCFLSNDSELRKKVITTTTQEIMRLSDDNDALRNILKYKELQTIVKHSLKILDQQQRQLITSLGQEFLLEKSKGQSKIDIYDFYLIQKIHQAILQIDSKFLRNKKTLTIKLNPTTQETRDNIQSTTNEMLSYRGDIHHAHKFAIFLIIGIFIQDLISGKSITDILENHWSFFLILAASTSLGRYLFTSGFEDGANALNIGEIDYCFDLVTIRDPYTNKPYEPAFIANFNPKPPQEITPAPAEDSDSDEITPSRFPQKEKRKLRAIQETPQKPIDRPINVSFFWNSESAWLGDPDGKISSDQTHPMRADYFPKKVYYYGFFNRTALENQSNTTEDGYNDAKSRVEKGQVVMPTGSSGIVQMRNRVGFKKIKVGGQEFFDSIFSWKTKNVKREDSVLGRSAARQLSKDGSVHVLVDFCYYMNKRPGH